MANEKIRADMNLLQIIQVMCGGNPGAIRVCVDVLKMGNAIDPQSWNEIAPILDLDTLGIYKDRIWVLYKYVCNENLGMMLAVLRAWQMGQLAGMTKEAIHNAIYQRGGIDLEAVVTAVKEQLPDFNPEVSLEKSGSTIRTTHSSEKKKNRNATSQQ